MKDRREFAELITGIAEVSGKSITKAGMRIWWASLERFSDEQVVAALNRHTQDPDKGAWMPKPSDIVRLIDGLPSDRAAAAWAKVDQAIRRIGGGPSWVFDDPAIHRVIEQMGGTSAFCKCPSEHDLTFLREQFCKRYASELPEPAAYPRKLAGWYKEPHVRFIGEPEKCQKVLEGGPDRSLQITRASDAAALVLEHRETENG